jgi:hypothetical protein
METRMAEVVVSLPDGAEKVIAFVLEIPGKEGELLFHVEHEHGSKILEFTKVVQWEELKALHLHNEMTNVIPFVRPKGS